MSAPILATKLYVPPLRPGVVIRSNLIERLNEGLSAKRQLTLISAPAGFGKTTLVSEWVTGCQRQIAWLSLDAADNDLSRFLTYLVAALQKVVPNAGEAALGSLQSPQPPPAESILTSLLNEIGMLPDNFIFVLDDYHVIDSRPVDEALTFLIEHWPAPMHLVIATREDPHLPLARLRVRGQLTELRAADLRFTAAEAAQFLNQVMGLSLSAEDIAALENRTEGWIAGLQLAALSMQGRENIAGFIQAFTGSHRFVFDYLAAEVLARQPESLRTFLLQTSILDRLNGSLCDAVTTQTGGQRMLDTLERSNLFVIPLDDRRQWYRFHHLFADVLQAHLVEAQPEQLSRLHQRASLWYEQNGFPPDAIRHALAAKDFERAAGLIELNWSAMDISYQSSTWLEWVKILPDQLIRTSPVLAVGYAWALLDSGEMVACEALLNQAEIWLNNPTEKMVVLDKAQFRSLPATIATARAYRSLALGDIPVAVTYAQKAFKLTPENDQIRYIQVTSLLGLAQYAGGDLVAAERSLSDFQIYLRKTNEMSTLVGIAFLLADIRVALGRLNEAENGYRQILHLATGQAGSVPLGTADLYRGLAELSIERNDLEGASQQLSISQKLGEKTAVTGWQHRLCVSQALLKEAQGDLAGALDLLDEAQRVYVQSPLPVVRPCSALKVKIWLKQKRLTEARNWAHEQGLSEDDNIPYSREFEYLTLAGVLLAIAKNTRETGFSDRANRLLQHLLPAAETGGRRGSIIQILVLQACAFQEQGDLTLAMASLERALTLAEPEGYVRTFVDAGPTLLSLIETRSLKRDNLLSGYSEKLRIAFAQPPIASKPIPVPPPSGLLEPLSERELEVLKLLRSELSGPQIARQLIVSLNTLRTHTKNVFTKLGVNNRRAAVLRAEELNLL
jgi:LuxR family transcriptional regulator, maltose regulon positive regulatory protein